VFDLKFLSNLYIIIKDKERCDTAGWGWVHKNQPKTYDGGPPDGELQEALVPIVALEICAKMWKAPLKDDPRITNKTICAGGLNTKDACGVCTK
jgi:hypothetical protein